jgi:hypothetical protein
LAKTITVGSCTFLFPEQGTKAGWGEVVTDTVCALATRLASISGANDIDLTTACICNNRSTATAVGSGAAALSFATSAVRSFDVTYVVVRTDACCVVLTEDGNMTGSYNGTAWTFNNEHTGCAGMCFQIASCGQVEYFSDACAGAGTIKFTAFTIAQ